MTAISIRRKNLQVNYGYIALPLAVALCAYLFSIIPADFTDWATVFYKTPASDPYSRYGFLNPYWLKWVIAPFNLFPMRYGFGLFITIVILFVFYIFRDKKYLIGASLFSPFFLAVLFNGQVDPIVLFGYWLLKNDNPLGVPFMLTKPQVMIGSLLEWFIYTSLKNKAISCIVTLVLITAGFALYGNWIVDMVDNINEGLFTPVSIAVNLPIVGIAIMVYGLIAKNMFITGLGTLFITPYIAMHSIWVYWTAWLLENPSKKWVVLLFIVNWIVAIIYT